MFTTAKKKIYSIIINIKFMLITEVMRDTMTKKKLVSSLFLDVSTIL